jgi:hypothetical protein
MGVWLRMDLFQNDKTILRRLSERRWSFIYVHGKRRAEFKIRILSGLANGKKIEQKPILGYTIF